MSTCIDGARAVYSYVKGHSVIFLTMGRGAMMNTSKKLGVTRVTSIEKEVVADGERFLRFSWFMCLVLAQGD